MDLLAVVFFVVPAILAIAAVFFGKTNWLPYAVVVSTVGLALMAFL